MPIIDPSNPLGLLSVASFAVQQILEALSLPIERWLGDSWKKTVLGVISFIIGLLLAWQLHLHVLEFFIPNDPTAPAYAMRGGKLDFIITALVLSAGTEGTNSVLKYLKYLKEDKKATAADTVQTLTDAARRAPITAVPVSTAALRTLNKLRAQADTSTAEALSFVGNK